MSDNDKSVQNNDLNTTNSNMLHTPHWKFFARLYGHLEEPKCRTDPGKGSASSSEVDVEERREEFRDSPPVWNTQVMPLYSTPPILPGSSFYNYSYNSYLLRRQKKENRPRRQRTTFSAEQTWRLEHKYSEKNYVVKAERCKLATELHLSENQVKIWFQNRRAKDKRIEKAHLDQRYRQLASASGLFPPTMLALYPPIASSLYPQLSPPYPYMPAQHPPSLDE